MRFRPNIDKRERERESAGAAVSAKNPLLKLDGGLSLRASHELIRRRCQNEKKNHLICYLAKKSACRSGGSCTPWQVILKRRLSRVLDVSLYSFAMQRCAKRSDPENSMSLLLTNANRIFDAHPWAQCDLLASTICLIGHRLWDGSVGSACISCCAHGTLWRPSRILSFPARSLGYVWFVCCFTQRAWKLCCWHLISNYYTSGQNFST